MRIKDEAESLETETGNEPIRPTDLHDAAMSFTNAPVTRTLVYGLVGMSIAASLLDIKHYFYILVDLHVWRFHQLWRALIYQLCYTNSSEVLFAAMTLYHMRGVERMWGPRKYAVSVIMDLWTYGLFEHGQRVANEC